MCKKPLYVEMLTKDITNRVYISVPQTSLPDMMVRERQPPLSAGLERKKTLKPGIGKCVCGDVSKPGW